MLRGWNADTHGIRFREQFVDRVKDAGTMPFSNILSGFPVYVEYTHGPDVF
jgi:hypothetical protein